MVSTISTRRAFLRGGATLLVGAGVLARIRPAYAYPLEGIMGVQSNDVGRLMQSDLQGTLTALASFGYRALDLVVNDELAAEHRKAMDAAGLVCHNAHFNARAFDEVNWAKTMATARTLGVKSMVLAGGVGRDATVDDWKKQADLLNASGARTKQEGLQLGWHNHGEFRAIDGQVPFDILLASTDPALVKFQIDVGNMAGAGGDPYMYLEKYPTRYYSIHVKDVPAGGRAGGPVGQGTLDFKRLFRLARAAGIRNYDVETGPGGDVMGNLRVSAEYLKNLRL